MTVFYFIFNSRSNGFKIIFFFIPVGQGFSVFCDQAQWQFTVVGVIASRVSSPLAEELASLSRLSYGPEAKDWNGESLAKALRSFGVIAKENLQEGDLLPPLMPTTSARN